MVLRKIIQFSTAVLVVFVSIWLVVVYRNSTVEYYQVFEDQRELFEAMKAEVESIDDSILGYQSNSGDIFLYSNGGNATPDHFHHEVNASLRGRIKQIKKLSENKLDQLRYSESGGQILIIFIFDWERAYGDTYHIVYSKSRDGVVRLYQANKVKYDLKELDDDWYGIRIR